MSDERTDTTTPPPEGEPSAAGADLAPMFPPRTSPDPRSVTGAWYTVRGKYGGRKEQRPAPGRPYQPGDRPWWWVLAYHVGGKVLGVVLTLAALWLAKVLGLSEEVRVIVRFVVGSP